MSKESSASTKVFQLSVLSQNDPGAQSGANLACVVTAVKKGTLLPDSLPVDQFVSLPIPPTPGVIPPPTPTWYLKPDPAVSVNAAAYTVEIFCPDDISYPPLSIIVAGGDVAVWGATPYGERKNQVYRGGDRGVFGFAQLGPEGLIYTITAGVLNPKAGPVGAFV